MSMSAKEREFLKRLGAAGGRKAARRMSKRQRVERARRAAMARFHRNDGKGGN